MLLSLLLLGGGCRAEEEPVERPASAERSEHPADTLSLPGTDSVAASEPPVELVDSSLLARSQPEEWGYRRSSQADLNGDGVPEEVVVAARAERVGNRIAWDDGQPWSVYVEGGGERTVLYARFVQLGILRVRVEAPDSTGRAKVLLIEDLPERMTLYEVDYLGPGESRVRRILERELDPRGDLASPTFP